MHHLLSPPTDAEGSGSSPLTMFCGLRNYRLVVESGVSLMMMLERLDSIARGLWCNCEITSLYGGADEVIATLAGVRRVLSARSNHQVFLLPFSS